MVLDGAIYTNEIMAATEANRFTRVPYDGTKPVHTFWDLGRADMTAIWFAQVVGFEFRIIDYYQNRGHALGHYLKHLQGRPYVYGDHWLPHDATNELLGSERTIAQQMEAAASRSGSRRSSASLRASTRPARCSRAAGSMPTPAQTGSSACGTTGTRSIRTPDSSRRTRCTTGPATAPTPSATWRSRCRSRTRTSAREAQKFC